MTTIEEQPVESRSHTWPGTNQATKITVHETANTNRGAGAQAHANLQSNGNVRKASWHIQVDDAEAIRSFPDDVRCWHAGRDAEDSLGLEICVNSDGDYDKALENAADVVRQWRAKHDLGRDDVVDHHYWTGKNCPTKLRSSGDWDAFVASTDPDGSTPAPKPSGSGAKPSRKSVAQLVAEVHAGKHGNGAARERSLGDRYAEVQEEINRRAGVSGKPKLSQSEVAQQIADGRGGWGNDPQRTQRLWAAGFNARAVQREVNQIVAGGGSSGGGKSISQLADEVERGVHGNGATRKRRLGARYDEVQAEINRRYS